MARRARGSTAKKQTQAKARQRRWKGFNGCGVFSLCSRWLAICIRQKPRAKEHTLSPYTAHHPGFLLLHLAKTCCGHRSGARVGGRTTDHCDVAPFQLCISDSHVEQRGQKSAVGDLAEKVSSFPHSFFFFVPVLELSCHCSPSPAHRTRPLLLLRGGPALCGPIAVAAGYCPSGDLSQITGGSPRRWRQ